MPNPNQMLAKVDGNVSSLQEWVAETRRERIKEQERLRTIKFGEYFPQIASPGPSFTTDPSITPDGGFLRDLRILSFKLSASDSVACYKGESAGGRLFAYGPPPGAAPAQNIVTINLGKDVLWRDGERLFFTTSGTGNIVAVYITYWQAAAEEQGKLY